MTGRPSHPFQAGSGGVLHAGSPDEHAANSVGWSLDVQQLGRGRFGGAISFALSSEAQFAVNEFSPGMKVAGHAPPGSVILAMMLGSAGQARWYGAQVDDSHALLVLPGRAIDVKVFRSSAIFTATMQPGRVRAYGEAILGAGFDLLASDLLGTGLAPEQRRTQFERIGLRDVIAGPGCLADPAVARQFEEKVLHAFCVGIRSPRRSGREPGSAALARRAEEFLMAHLDRPITIRDLCVATAASERTLHDAFRRHLGTTPKAYLKQMRLNAVRRELERGAPGSSITEVAMRWGFFHPGWFSHDYRRTFHRTPSDTLRAARAGAAVLG